MKHSIQFFLRIFFLLWIFNIFSLGTAFGQTQKKQKDENPSKKRIWIASGLTAYTEIGSFAALYKVWYSQNSNSSFHFFDDFGNWGNVDKYGHAYSAYQLSRTCSNLYKWSGLSNKKSALIGSAIGLSYQTTLEIFDGFSAGYGFSWGDVMFNFIGAGVFLSQEFIFEEQRVLPKFSYHPTHFAQLRPEMLGSNQAERFLKDYNGQTYWLSFSPGYLIKSDKFPKWLCLSIGYGIDSRIVGNQTIYVDQLGNEYHSQSQYYLSLDLDLKKIPVNNKTIRKILTAFNYLKIPAPAVSLQGKEIKFYPICF